MKQERKYWLDDPRNVDKIFYAICALCALVALLDFGGAFYDKDAHFGPERIWNFHGFYGFVSCWALVLAAKRLRRLVRRKEDFYD